MDAKRTYNRILRIFEMILRNITDKYVMFDLPIPEDVLALKDEACSVTSKAADESRPEVLEGYLRRIAEILVELREKISE